MRSERLCAIQRILSVEKGLVKNARVRLTALHRRFIEVQPLLNNLENHCIPPIFFPVILIALSRVKYEKIRYICLFSEGNENRDGANIVYSKSLLL
ncbi:hypothetical protein CY34DRAFT_808237 [Suillus luteus UH-Slu-Lm8-n1]|uniref:Uncharacterized protein n=1 Tax=Suillus luteus UH-Slu-Lm8-n1 TaxID=930992 RepID=A0A0D0AYY7_9AGAM|nr:hypothetical protein CY34DRAFT_808237 [Suillus luteus UH-Slu-Lm8-n1]